MLLATHAGVIMARQLPLQEAADLEIGLASSREIGLAMGVLMHTDKITETTRSTCSASPASAATANCELATEVTDTDTLEAT